MDSVEQLTGDGRSTRAEFVRRAAAGAVLGGSLLGVSKALAAAPRRTFVVSAAQLAQARRNIFTSKLEFAKRAWDNTAARADELLGYGPNPTDPRTDLSDWRSTVYLPGLEDGRAAVALAQAYAIGGKEIHAQRAKAICLAWARTYRPVPSQDRIGHFVAEPVGPVIKLCMAYDLAKPVFSSVEQAEFRSWAAQFVQRGRGNADFCKDRPWEPDVIYGGDRSNPASYGNSATWQRAMAVWAAAVVGPAALTQTLEWSFQHRTSRGFDFGWDDILEGLVIDGAGGEIADGRFRRSIVYGNYAWFPLVLIADVARNAGFRVDLFKYRTNRHGYTIFTPLSYYARFAVTDDMPDALESSPNGTWPSIAARHRAMYEVLYRNATDPALVKSLRTIVNWHGGNQRGDNYDSYILANGALFGRGPKGPLPEIGKRA